MFFFPGFSSPSLASCQFSLSHSLSVYTLTTGEVLMKFDLNSWIGVQSHWLQEVSVRTLGRWRVWHEARWISWDNYTIHLRFGLVSSYLKHVSGDGVVALGFSKSVKRFSTEREWAISTEGTKDRDRIMKVRKYRLSDSASQSRSSEAGWSLVHEHTVQRRLHLAT